MGKIIGSSDLMKRIAHSTKNVSRSVIRAPPVPYPAVLSVGGEMTVILNFWRLGLRYCHESPNNIRFTPWEESSTITPS